MPKKLLVIGLDGASFNVLDHLSEKGFLPHIAKLVRGGARADLETTFPPITASAWSSFMTGKNPGKHGIFEFMKRDQDSKRELAVNASFRQGPAIWDLLSEAGNRVVVHNFPCTYPPHAINGAMIADFMTPRGRRDFAYPQGLLEELEKKFGPYRLHLSQTYAGANAEGVLEELFDELEYKAKVTDYLMDRYDWDAFFQYFWGTDRIQHELWHIIDESHPRHDRKEAAVHRPRVYEYFRRVDEIVGDLVAKSGDGALVWIASDHGFGPVHTYCAFNIWLLQEGFLQLNRSAATRLKKLMFSSGLTPELAFKLVKKLPLGPLRPSRGASNQPGTSKLLSTLFLSLNDVDWTRTQAFSKGNYGQIYINLKGREPNGAVEEDQYAALCEKIIQRLHSIEDPQTGEEWIGKVFRRDEIYSGPRVADAPDIAFLPHDMRYLPLGNADFTSNKFMVKAFGITGSHRMNGVMIANGGPVKAGISMESASICDITPTLLYLLGRDIPDDLDGRVITDIISEHHLDSHPVHYSAGTQTDERNEVTFSDQENAEIRDALRNLGYLG
jgi:predicted AlkP superfamily phosphohydrolase/phosphomutase